MTFSDTVVVINMSVQMLCDSAVIVMSNPLAIVKAALSVDGAGSPIVNSGSIEMLSWSEEADNQL